MYYCNKILNKNSLEVIPSKPLYRRRLVLGTKIKLHDDRSDEQS
jgi:hypothetical protein